MEGFFVFPAAPIGAPVFGNVTVRIGLLGTGRCMSFIGEDPVAKGLADSLARPRWQRDRRRDVGSPDGREACVFAAASIRSTSASVRYSRVSCAIDMDWSRDQPLLLSHRVVEFGVVEDRKSVV